MNDQRDLEGISALITGATSGIGRAAAEELGRHGAEVVVHGSEQLLKVSNHEQYEQDLASNPITAEDQMEITKYGL